MKSKTILPMAATAAVLIQSALATAALPEFKSREEIRAIRAEQAAMRESALHADLEQSEAEAFYTGKAVDSDTGLYLFMYRSYDPELSRWDAFDPSGFPDGPNNGVYPATPLWTVDIAGLISHHVFSNQVHTISFTVGVFDDSGETTTQRLASWESAVASAWSFSGTDKADGISSLSFTTNISFHLITGTFDEQAALGQFDNVVTFIPTNMASHVTDGYRRGYFRYNIESNVVVHEVGIPSSAATRLSGRPLLSSRLTAS